MQHKMKILATLLTAGLSVSAIAEQQVINGSFTTIKAVTISEITPISFTGLPIANASSCAMTASADGTGTGYLGDVAMRLGTANANAVGSSANTMDACVGTGTTAIGVYEIDGASGATVNITITDGTNADLAIVPAGCAGNYVAGADGDSCDTVSQVAGAVAVRLAGSTDTGSLGEGTPVEGTSLIALGGTVTAQQDLSAGTTYTVDFDISVTY